MYTFHFLLKFFSSEQINYKPVTRARTREFWIGSCNFQVIELMLNSLWQLSKATQTCGHCLSVLLCHLFAHPRAWGSLDSGWDEFQITLWLQQIGFPQGLWFRLGFQGEWSAEKHCQLSFSECPAAWLLDYSPTLELEFITTQKGKQTLWDSWLMASPSVTLPTLFKFMLVELNAYPHFPTQSGFSIHSWHLCQIGATGARGMLIGLVWVSQHWFQRLPVLCKWCSAQINAWDCVSVFYRATMELLFFGTTGALQYLV